MSYTRKRHSLIETRNSAKKHVKRKEFILKNIYDAPTHQIEFECTSYYGYTKGQPHRLSKNKVHCSCPLCSSKTKLRGYKHSDVLKMMKEKDFDINGRE